MRRALLPLVLLLNAAPAMSHPASTAYLEAQAEGRQLTLRADYALADLDDALGLDGNGDGRITWAEVQAASPTVLAYLTPRLSVQGDGRDCLLTVRPGLEISQRNDGPYAVWQFSARCAQAPQTWRLDSRALFELDSHHRVLLRFTQAGREQRATLSPRQPSVTLSSRRAAQ